MFRPRLMYYNDAHHFHAKRIEPPATIHKLQQPVDELLGTGVDLLVLGLGYGDVYFHQSKVGRVVGQEKQVWENFIDWRIMRMVEEAHRLGTDQVKVVRDRAREKKIGMLPSLKMQDTAKPPGERCGWLKWKHGLDVCLGGPEENRERWALDYTNPIVRAEKMALVREMLEDYRTDGIELDFMFYPVYFRPCEVEKGTAIMTYYVASIRRAADEIGKAQGRRIPVTARVFHRRDDNLRLGLDVESWLKNKSIDAAVGQVSYFLMDTDLTEGRWLADAANAAGAASYIRPPRYVYDDRTLAPSIEMYRALNQTLNWHGFTGMYLGYLPWPLGDSEYELLREMAFLETTVRRNKRYLLQPGETAEQNAAPPKRQVPAPLKEGQTTSVKVLVSDDLGAAMAYGELRPAILTVRFSDFCIEDDIEMRLNGQVLKRGDAEITDERALHMPALPGWYRGKLNAPAGMAAHWFRYKVPVDLLKRGENLLEIECKKFSPRAAFTRSLNGVEIQTRYKEFERPVGLNVERITPRG